VKRKRHYTFLLRLLGIVLIILILTRIDVRKTFELIRSARVFPLAFVAATSFLAVIMRAWRWHILLRAQGIVLSFPRAVHVYAASYFIGSVTPARVGEVARAYYLARTGACSGWEALPSVLADRLLDVIVVLILGISGLFFWNFLDLSGTMVVLVSLVLCSSLFLFSPRISGLVAEKLFFKGPFRRWLKKYEAGGVDFTQGLMALTGRNIVIPFVLTLAIYATYFMQASIIVYALGIPAGYFDIGLALSCAMIVSMVPVTIAGIGTREAALIFFLGRLGISAEQSVSFSLVIFAVFYVLVSLLSAVFHFSLSDRSPP
jgi:uncharacterized protein (TIRG00374 family)